MRNITPEQQRLLDIVTKAREDEKLLIVKADAEARERRRALRQAANAAVHAAWQAGAPKTRINAALGTTSPGATDQRLREFAAQTGQEAEPEGGVTEVVPAEPAVPPVRIKRHDDGGYTVKLTKFSHPDVGDDLTMWVRYDADDNAMIRDGEDVDAMFALKLWSTSEVQRALADA